MRSPRTCAYPTSIARSTGPAWRKPKASPDALAGRGPAPDLLVTSPARRTRQTADALALAMGIPAYRMQDERRLYLAPAETILEHIRLTEPSVQHLMIVGHNPGLSDLASWLAGPGRITTGLSTGSAYILTFESESWSDVAPSVLVEVLCESPQP